MVSRGRFERLEMCVVASRRDGSSEMGLVWSYIVVLAHKSRTAVVTASIGIHETAGRSSVVKELASTKTEVRVL